MKKTYKEEKLWNRFARIYDRVENKDKDIFDSIISKTKEYLKNDDILLDFGCGTGIITNEIAGSVSSVCAIDISPKMLEIAEEKAAKRNILNVNYKYTDIFSDKMKAGTFDAVLAFYILHLFKEPEIVLRRISELLKPGGVIISVTPCMREKPLLKGLLTILNKFRLVPYINSLTQYELMNYIANENFKIIKKECLRKNSAQYFIVARKP
jgi:ubiquinone/menaquinone biosynthesis C-methylase UbiE